MSDDEQKSRGGLWVTVGGAAMLVACVPMVAVSCMGVMQQSQQQQATSSCTVTAGGDGQAQNVPNGWGPLVDAAAEEAGLPAELIAAQIAQESQWDPEATSPVGAEGLAQFMPGTWAEYGQGGDPFNPDDAIPALGRYMADLKQQVGPIAGDDGDELVRLTLAAYNAGPGAVQEHNGVPPFAETEGYVQKILGGGQSNYSADCEAIEGGKAWDGDLGDGEWTTPLPNSTMTGAGSFGSRNIAGYPDWANQHAGIDLSTDHSNYGLGGPVVAPAPLEVIDIYEPDGCVQTRLTGEDDSPEFGMSFCHLGEIDAQIGDTLSRGGILGTEGNQGENLGNPQGGKGFITHLHFEIYPPDTPESEMVIPGNDSAIDPEPILKEKGAWPE